MREQLSQKIEKIIEDAKTNYLFQLFSIKDTYIKQIEKLDIEFHNGLAKEDDYKALEHIIEDP